MKEGRKDSRKESSVYDTIEDDTPCQYGRVPIKWSETSYRVSEVSSLPCVASYDSRAYHVSREVSNIDWSQPFLFYASRQITKVSASTLIWDDKEGKYNPFGDPLIVPADYAGWFEVVSSSSREDEEGHIPQFQDVGSIAVSDCSKFLIGGTDHVDALLIKGDNPADTGNHLHHSLLPGDILKVGCVYEGKATKQKLLDRMLKKTTTKRESFLKCWDEKEREVLIPVNATGRFYSISTCERGTVERRGVRQIRDILRSCKLPCVVRLIFGEVPSTRCAFTGTLMLQSQYEQSSVLAATMFYRRNIFVEIPADIPLKFRVAERDSQLTDSEAFRSALRMCKEKMDVYKKKIKINCLLDRAQNVVDPPTTGHEEEGEGEAGKRVPSVPPKTPRASGARESFFQSLECTEGSPTPTPPYRTKKKSAGGSPLASRAGEARRKAERCKSEGEQLDSDYELIWWSRQRADSAAPSLATLASPSTPRKESPTPSSADPPRSLSPHLGGRTSPDGRAMSPVPPRKDVFDDLEPSKSSPDGGYITPIHPADIGLDKGPLLQDALDDAAKSGTKKRSAFDALSVVPPPPPQENKPGRKTGYVNVTRHSQVVTVGFTLDASAGNIERKGLQLNLEACPPPPLPPKERWGKEGFRDDVTGLPGQPEEPTFRSTGHSVQVMVRDSCVYLPMEPVAEGECKSPSPLWSSTTPSGRRHAPGHAPRDFHSPCGPDGDVYVFADGLEARCAPKPAEPEPKEESIYQNISDLRPLILGWDEGNTKEGTMRTSASCPSKLQQQQQQSQTASDWRTTEDGESTKQTEPGRKKSAPFYVNVPFPHQDLPASFGDGTYRVPRSPPQGSGPPLPPKTFGSTSATLPFDLGTKFHPNAGSSSSLPELLGQERAAPPLPLKKNLSFNVPPSRKPLVRSWTLGDVGDGDDDDDPDYDVPRPSSRLRSLTASSADPRMLNSVSPPASFGLQPSAASEDSTEDAHDYQIPRSAKYSPKAKARSSGRSDYETPRPPVNISTRESRLSAERPRTPPRVRKPRGLGEAEQSTIPRTENVADLQAVPEESQPNETGTEALLSTEPISADSTASSTMSTDDSETQAKSKGGEEKTSSGVPPEIKSEEKETLEDSNTCKKQKQSKRGDRDDEDETVIVKDKLGFKPGPSKSAKKKPAVAAKPQCPSKPSLTKAPNSDEDKTKAKSKTLSKTIQETQKSEKSEKVTSSGKTAPLVNNEPKTLEDVSAPKAKMKRPESHNYDVQNPSPNPFLPKGGLKPTSDRPRSNSLDTKKGTAPGKETKNMIRSTTVGQVANKFARSQNADAKRPTVAKKPHLVLCGRGFSSMSDEGSCRLGKPSTTHTIEKVQESASATGSSEGGEPASQPPSRVRPEECDEDSTDTLAEMTSPQLLRALATVGLRQETRSVLEAEKIDGQQLAGMDAVAMREAFPLLRNIDIKKIQMFVHGWRPKE